MEVGDALTARFSNTAGPLTFYAWHDRQAGRLRRSTASVSTDRLPFGGHFRPVDHPAPVLASMATDVHPGLVLWEELADGGSGQESGLDSQPSGFFAFPVFAVKVV